MSQHYPASGVDGPEITPEYVSRRVDDWLDRLNDLFDEIKLWARANGWSVRDGEPIPMREEPMDRMRIPGRQQPSLSVLSPQGVQIWIKPKGLWVIGANGRVDIFSHKGTFTLVDVADPFATPQWILHRIGHTKGKRFEPKQVADMV